jgi:hypothetical protein
MMKKYPFLQAPCYTQISILPTLLQEGRRPPDMLFLLQNVTKRQFPGQGSNDWEALDLIPSRALQGAVKELFFHWQAASSKSQEKLLSPRENLGKHIIASVNASQPEMTQGTYVLRESPSYICKHQQLSTFLCRSLNS